MKWIKWILYNAPIVFIIVDGTYGITQYSNYSANFIPFLTILLLLLSIAVFVAMTLLYSLYDEMERDKLIELRGKLYKTTKTKQWLNFILDFGLTIWLAIFGFTISAVLYLLHYVIGVIAILLKNETVEELKEI